MRPVRFAAAVVAVAALGAATGCRGHQEPLIPRRPPDKAPRTEPRPPAEPTPPIEPSTAAPTPPAASAAPSAAASPCESACVHDRQMQAVSIEQIHRDCRAECSPER